MKLVKFLSRSVFLPATPLAKINSVALLAKATMVQEMMNGIIVRPNDIFLPNVCTQTAAIGVQNMLTSGTDVAIHDPSELVVGIEEFGDWITDKTGEVQPVIVPVWELFNNAKNLYISLSL